MDAKDFTTWLSQKSGRTYRLPSEAEWEYAARAGTNTAYWWRRDVRCRQGNCREGNTHEPQRTTHVGSFEPNALRLYDTADTRDQGCERCWLDTYRGSPHEPHS